MTVRNPHRPWWLGIALEVVERSGLCEQIAERIGRSREALRIRWAARHACARLRAELAASQAREARLRELLDEKWRPRLAAIKSCSCESRLCEEWSSGRHDALKQAIEELDAALDADGKDQPK